MFRCCLTKHLDPSVVDDGVAVAVAVAVDVVSKHHS